MLSYPDIVAEATRTNTPVVGYLREELPYVCRDEYVRMMPSRMTNICLITRGSFEYLFDDYATLEATGAVETDAVTESRVVAVVGTSEPNLKKRDDYRLRGWVGRTEATFGKQWDKGHFIAHSIGGAVDGWELNVYLQLRSLNRGWSEAGRRYREMEKYCAANAGVLCWNRPIYTDPSAKPAQIEFGIVRTAGDLWIEVFDNR